MKFVFMDEELSCLLSAHESGQLIRGGLVDFGLSRPPFKGSGCALQIAFNHPDNGAFDYHIRFTSWFDNNYDPNWPADFFLYELEQQGVA